MSKRQLKVGNAPCSWGVLEFEDTKGEEIGFERMLDELTEAGYTGTELGDWGYMPTDPGALSQQLDQRGLVMLGAFVAVGLKEGGAHAEGIATAVKTAKLLAAVGKDPAPYLVLADNNGSVPDRTHLAGRIAPKDELTSSEWKVFGSGADSIARAVFEESGLRTVFHHHCAGYVETPDEIETLLELTDSQHLGLVFDTGHYLYGSGNNGCDVISAFDRYASRIWYVHCKDCNLSVAQQAREKGWDYFTALRHGVFCELGKGGVDFPAVLRRLGEDDYQGYVLVEQDVLPGMGAPKESAKRNLEYLRSIEANFTEVSAHD